MRKYLIHLQQAPFANSMSLEMQELAFSLSAFAQEVTLLFSGDGVLQLTPQIQNNYKDFTKAYSALELFDIHSVYVERKSAQQIVDQISIPVKYTEDILELQKEFDVIIAG